MLDETVVRIEHRLYKIDVYLQFRTLTWRFDPVPSQKQNQYKCLDHNQPSIALLDGPFQPLIFQSILIVYRRNTLRSEEHTSELQSRGHLVCRLLLEKKK